ncbi:universal stress protein [Microbacterium azadirachtae]|uniref:universal stress protein n=1 Tax=Microbacterium azadirachtae TaxID=582680 RepID=UPI000890C500|nr:universal stress protein [Microbacterium azadirachtae]SDL88633.1 Nucleotide-binding universal stress protein, UspA family [Microbacterium azadirachtae]SEG18802.1 Nucleotide-binding universal stress protein, UspA family [Microbacterium azadirachtae]SEG21114.1 Nucleotide-binding universal stress protein, UspA family [Microbacterium azadirachtae]
MIALVFLALLALLAYLIFRGPGMQHRANLEAERTFVPASAHRESKDCTMNTNANAPVLVGVDGSESSRDALRYAGQIAAALGAPLRVITTWDYPALIDLYPTLGWAPDVDAATILETAVKDVFGANPPAELSTSVLAGPAAAALIKESRGAEMLVLGSRGRGGFVGLLLGSVSATCATHAHCPVLIVRREQHDEREEHSVD